MHQMSGQQSRLHLQGRQKRHSERGVCVDLVKGQPMYHELTSLRYLRDLQARVRAYEENDPQLRPGPVSIRQTRPTTVVTEETGEEELDDELLLPEAFTQMSVESPGNTTTGEFVPARLCSLRLDFL